MHITLAAIGKLKDPALKILYDEYKKRLEWKVTVYEFEAPPRQEEALLFKAHSSFPFLISLDERGKNLKSEEFAFLLRDIQIHHNGKLAFAIGGAEGLSDKIKANSQKLLAFGLLTWPHLWVRVMLMEQLYRAQQILKNHPYHRG